MTTTKRPNYPARVLGFIAAALAAVVVVLAFFNYNVTAQRDHYEQTYIPELEWRVRTLENYEKVYIRERLIEEQQRAEKRDRAMEACEALVQSQMTDVVTDPLGNPIDVTTFAATTCEDDLRSVGLDAFVEKFAPRG